MTHTTPGSLRPRLFPTGRLGATPGALALLEANGQDYQNLIDRHTTGDWGDLCAGAAQENNEALKNGSRLLSSYRVGKGGVWVITDSDRLATTILLPEEQRMMPNQALTTCTKPS